MDHLAHIDMDQLTAFLRIVRDGSFSRAAQSLRIGQPAISSRIQTLESSIGGALFTRGRRIALTPLGERFLPYARRTLEVLAEGIEVSRLAQEGKRGRVTLGVLGSLCEGLIGPMLEQFIRSHPEVECVMRSGDHETIVSFLWDGIVELGLVVWPCADTSAADLSPLLLLQEPVVLVAHPKHPLATRKRVTPEDIAKLANPFLLLRWWQDHRPEMVQLAQKSGTHLEIPKEAARHLVLLGVGAGFFSRTFIASDLERGALVEIKVRDFPKLHRTSALVSRSNPSSLSPAAQNLIQALKKQTSRLRL